MMKRDNSAFREVRMSATAHFQPLFQTGAQWLWYKVMCNEWLCLESLLSAFICSGKEGEWVRETSLLSSEEVHSQNQAPLQSWHDFHTWLMVGAESILYPECTAASQLHSSSSSMQHSHLQHIRFIWMKNGIHLNLSPEDVSLFTLTVNVSEKHRARPQFFSGLFSGLWRRCSAPRTAFKQGNASIIVRKQYIAWFEQVIWLKYISFHNTHCFKA